MDSNSKRMYRRSIKLPSAYLIVLQEIMQYNQPLQTYKPDIKYTRKTIFYGGLFLNWEKMTIELMSTNTNTHEDMNRNDFILSCKFNELATSSTHSFLPSEGFSSIYFVKHGTCQLSLNNSQIKLVKSSCAVVLPGRTANIENIGDGKAKYIILQIKFPNEIMEDYQYNSAYPDYFNDKGYIKLVGLKEAENIFDRILESQTEGLSNDFIMKLLGCDLLYSIYVHIGNNVMKKADTSNIYVQKAINTIEGSLEQKWTTDLLASKLHLNKYHLLHIFKQHTGQSLMDFVNTRRINRSMRLLQDTTMKVYEVAELVGIYDAHYFSSIFKKHTGMTPEKFRKFVKSTLQTRQSQGLSIKVNCGGEDTYTLLADQRYKPGEWGFVGEVLKFRVKRNVIPDFGIGKCISSIVYTNIFWYRFDVPNGDFIVRLYFAELYFESPGKRCFDVKINGLIVLDNYDIICDAGGYMAGVEKTFKVAVTNGVLQIEFSARVNMAQVNAIIIEAI